MKNQKQECLMTLNENENVDVDAYMYGSDLANFIETAFVEPKQDEAIIVDLDGTLAHHEHRDPYDWRSADGDTIDPIVEEIVNAFSKRYTIIICSGRPEPSREININWLSFYNIPYNKMFLRKRKDTRADYVIKKEIYEKYIEPNYRIKFVLDDRDSVVEMWRSKGLKCLQVEPGDF